MSSPLHLPAKRPADAARTPYYASVFLHERQQYMACSIKYRESTPLTTPVYTGRTTWVASEGGDPDTVSSVRIEAGTATADPKKPETKTLPTVFSKTFRMVSLLFEAKSIFSLFDFAGHRGRPLIIRVPLR
jgi:hypothetical protein